MTCSRSLNSEQGGRVLDNRPFSQCELRQRAVAMMLSGGLAYPAFRRAVCSAGLAPVEDSYDSSAVSIESVVEMLGYSVPGVSEAASGWKYAVRDFCKTGKHSSLPKAIVGAPVGNNLAISIYTYVGGGRDLCPVKVYQSS